MGDFCLCKGVLWIANFNSSPVAGPYQTDKTQEICEGPGHVRSMVTPSKVLSAHL